MLYVTYDSIFINMLKYNSQANQCEKKATTLYKWGVGGMTIHMEYIKM
jgi:hypothetical protein